MVNEWTAASDLVDTARGCDDEDDKYLRECTAFLLTCFSSIAFAFLRMEYLKEAAVAMESGVG